MKERECRHDCNVHCIYKNYNRIDCFRCDGWAVDAGWEISSIYQMGAWAVGVDSNAGANPTAACMEAISKVTKEGREKNNEE